MNADDLEPTVNKDIIKDLDVMSIEALGDYISELEEEIERVKEAVIAKKRARSSAERVFDS